MEIKEPKMSRGGRARKVILALTIWAALALGVRLVMGVLAAEPAATAFNQTWERTDDPVASGLIDRTWMWGPDGFTDAMTETYAESPGGERTVQYFDKSRMEDNGFRASAPWDVTNGLLVVELVTGQMQVGDNDFEQRLPAAVNVAGDADDPTGVQYATLASLLDEPALPDGATVTQRLDRSGNVTSDPALASFGVTATYRVSVLGVEHQVASPFWEFMNSSGTVYENGSYLTAPMFLSPFYATGYPITEAYWAEVKVGGTYQDVLLQCFERRCLTYTPGNAPGWQVEAGNVGQHYYEWRYGQLGDDATPTPPVTGTENPDPTQPPATGTPGASPTAEPSPTATMEPSPSPTVEPTPTATAIPEPPSYSFAGKFGREYNPATVFDGPGGVGVGPDGSVYILESNADRVQQHTPEGAYIRMWGESGSGAGQFDRPRAIAFDRQGNIYVSDWQNDRIQKFDPKGNPIGQIGSFGFDDGEFFTVYGIAFDSQGYLYAADTNSHRIQKFDSNGDFVAKWGGGLSLAGGGSPKPGEFAWPLGVAVDADDNVYVVDSGNHRIQVFDTQGNLLAIWGKEGGGNGQFNGPAGIAISDNGVIYVADQGNDRIQAFNRNGDFLRKWGKSGSEPGQFTYPEGVAVDDDGNVYVVEPTNNRIQKFDGRGNYLDGWSDGRRGTIGRGALDLAIDEDGNVYVIDFDRVQKFDADGRFLREIGEPSGPGDLENPSSVVASPDGYLFVADVDLEKIVKFTLDGQFVDEWSVADDVTGLALAEDGNIYAIQFDARRLRKFSTSGATLGSWDMSAVLRAPLDIAIDGDRLFVADVDATRLAGVPAGPSDVPTVKVFDLDDRTFLGTLGEPDQFDIPYGIGIDANGFVYVADIGTNTVQQFAPNGTYLSTLGGPGSGNGQFRAPTAVQIATDGTLYVLDTRNSRVQVFE